MLKFGKEAINLNPYMEVHQSICFDPQHLLIHYFKSNLISMFSRYAQLSTNP
jgi:hypothetical protein